MKSLSVIITVRFARYSDLILSCEVLIESDIHNHCQKRGRGQIFLSPLTPTLSLQGRGEIDGKEEGGHGG